MRSAVPLDLVMGATQLNQGANFLDMPPSYAVQQ
jgi:hypothetical protein